MSTVGLIGRLSAVALVACLAGCGGGSGDGGVSDGRSSESAQSLNAAPTVTTFSPAKAVQGALVTINGTGFVNGASVSFNGTESSSVIVASSKRLSAVVPAGCTSGPISITVPAGTAETATDFQVLPKLTGVAPLHAFVGDFVTISGSGLTATSGVKLGALSATFTVTSDSSISASVPDGFTGGKVSVTTPAGSAATTTSLVVLPLLSVFSPTQGPIGSSVTVTGEGFTRASAVKFGVKAATFSVVSDSELTAAVPVGAVASKITVETPDGNRTSTGTFSVILAPSITSFAPLAGELPLTLTVNGKNFLGVSAVTVGGLALPSFTLVSTKQLTAPLPLGTPSGKVSIVNAAGTAVSSASFTATSCSDSDADGVCDRDDLCPGSDDLLDSDADGTADGCDVCPSASSSGQTCGAGLACDGAGACNVELECTYYTQGPGVLQGSVVIDDIDTADDVALLADKWCVGGDVTVTTTDFTDLSALSGLVEVAGSLTIGGSAPNCSFGCKSGNQLLTSLHGLEGLRGIGGTLELREDPLVGSLAPLGNLKKLGNLTISNSTALTDLHGLEGVRSLRWLFIEYADALSSLAGVQNLTQASMVRLDYLPQLTDISALSQLTALPDGFEVAFTGLASLHGLEGLTSVANGGVQIAYNPNVTDLSPLSNLRTTGGLLLQGRGITSLAPLSELTSVSTLSLWDVGLTSLEGLGGITSPLSQLQILQNTWLTSLSGLANVPVQGWFKMEQNPSLLDCGSFSVGPDASVDFDSNDALASLSCLTQSTGLRQLSLVHLPALGNLDDLAALTQVSSSITLGNLDQLASLSGLSQLQTAGGVDIAYTNLTDLHGLEGLTTLGSLSLRHNLQLSSLAGVSGLIEVSYWVYLESNWHLSQCEILNLEAQLGRSVDYNVDNGPGCEL